MATKPALIISRIVVVILQIFTTVIIHPVDCFCLFVLFFKYVENGHELELTSSMSPACYSVLMSMSSIRCNISLCVITITADVNITIYE